MRLLAALLVGSGVAWIAGILLAYPHLLIPSVASTLVVAACYVVVATGVVLTARRTSQLPGRLGALWALAVIALGVALAPLGVSWLLVASAALYGTIAFGLWAAPPLVVFSVVSGFRSRPDPVPGPANQPPVP